MNAPAYAGVFLAAVFGEYSMPEQILSAFLQQQLDAGASAGPVISRLVCGFSGGLDSTVLLHALAEVAPLFKLPVLAVHVHHGLSPNADAWAEHAALVCKRLGIELRVQRVMVSAQGSLEAAARDARRQAFARILQAGDALLLAQHQDDQAETVLFRLLRGSGVTGLAAMQAVGHFPLKDNVVPLWRPFLGLSRQQLEQQARAQQLLWIEDESNKDEQLARNFLRHRIFPLLNTRWPAANVTLAATAQRMREADALLQEMAEAMAVRCIDGRGCLFIPELQSFAEQKNGTARQRLLLRYWLQVQGFALPDEALLEKIITEVVAAREDAAPLLSWSAGEIRRYRQHLYAMPALSAIPSGWERAWQPDLSLSLPDNRQLTASIAPGVATPAFTVRYRRGGEKLRCGGHLRDLKTLLQEAGIPPWERERLPLLFAEDELLAVIGTDLRAEGWPSGIELKLS